MALYDAYVLRVWHSTGRDGRQWTGRLEHLGDGESVCFNDPEALLRHLGQLFGKLSDHTAVGVTHAERSRQ